MTLYASWTKASGDPENPGKDMVKELQSTGETKEKIEFATEVSKDYKLDIKSNHLSQYGIIATNTGNGTKSPQTGDNSNLALWFAVLFISGGVLTVFSIASKKKRVGINK